MKPENNQKQTIKETSLKWRKNFVKLDSDIINVDTINQIHLRQDGNKYIMTIHYSGQSHLDIYYDNEIDRQNDLNKIVTYE